MKNECCLTERYFVVHHGQSKDYIIREGAIAMVPPGGNHLYAADESARDMSNANRTAYFSAVSWSVEKGVRVVLIYNDGKAQVHATHCSQDLRYLWADVIAPLVCEYLDTAIRADGGVELDQFRDISERPEAWPAREQPPHRQ